MILEIKIQKNIKKFFNLIWNIFLKKIIHLIQYTNLTFKNLSIKFSCNYKIF